jgi:hypothetical protein
MTIKVCADCGSMPATLHNPKRGDLCESCDYWARTVGDVLTEQPDFGEDAPHYYNER